MISKDELPDVIVLRPNAGGLWLTYLIWLPTLTLLCFGTGVNLFSDQPFDAERIAFTVFGICAVGGWILLVWKTLRTISAFRFHARERQFSITYVSTKRVSFSADVIADCRTLEGSPRRPHYHGPKDRVIHLRSGLEFHFPDLHVTGIKPEGFDHLMKLWGVPVRPLPVEGAPDQTAYFTTNAEGVGVFQYRPARGWILLCLTLAIGFPIAGATYLPQLIQASRIWAILLLCGVLGLGSYALLFPLLRYPSRATLGPSGVQLGYLFRPRKTLGWSDLEGFAVGKVKVGRHDTLNPAVILYPKQGAAILLVSNMIRGVEHAPFRSFGLAQLEAPRPFHLFSKVPARPGQ